MLEFCTSGSVGDLGGRPPSSTWPIPGDRGWDLARGGRLGAQGVGAASDGRVGELDHRLVLLPGQGELGEGEPPRYLPPQEVGGTGLILNRRMKRPWLVEFRPLTIYC